jgi:lipopolysaccharide biosynthesis glycosyltransferase
MVTMNVITVSDDNYAQHLGVMLYSLFEHASVPGDIGVTVLDGGISEENRKNLEAVAEAWESNVVFMNTDASLYSKLATKRHISHAAYFKLSIPDLFAEQAERILFLDCDMIIKRDISELWSIDLNGFCLAAVHNPLFERHDQLKLSKSTMTFNSGLMLINIPQWQKENISEQALVFLQKNSHKIKLHDQDGLNAVLAGDCLFLHPKWNQQTKYFELTHHFTSFTKKEFKCAKNNPSVIHYTTSSKPWQLDNVHPYKEEYRSRLLKTPWKEYKYNYTSKFRLYRSYLYRVVPNKLIGLLKYFLKPAS